MNGDSSSYLDQFLNALCGTGTFFGGGGADSSPGPLNYLAGQGQAAPSWGGYDMGFLGAVGNKPPGYGTVLAPAPPAAIPGLDPGVGTVLAPGAMGIPQPGLSVWDKLKGMPWGGILAAGNTALKGMQDATSGNEQKQQPQPLHPSPGIYSDNEKYHLAFLKALAGEGPFSSIGPGYSQLAQKLAATPLPPGFGYLQKR